MDFSQFDSVAASDRGAWMHAHSPINGQPLYADEAKEKPCRVRVLGAEGEVGQKIFAESRKALKGDESDEDHMAKLVKRISPLVVGFENIDRGDKPAEAPADVAWFLNLQRVVGGDLPSFLEQVQAFALKRANHLGNVSGG